MIHRAGEDYLEAVMLLKEKHGYVRSIDLAEHMGVSKPSISYAVKALQDEGYLVMDGGKYLCLTESGHAVAERMYERHSFFTQVLSALGVDPAQAEADACKIEHIISDESFEKLKEHCQKHRFIPD